MHLVSETRDCVRKECNGRMLRNVELENSQIKKFFRCDLCNSTMKVLTAFGYDKGKWNAPKGMEFTHVIHDELGV